MSPGQLVPLQTSLSPCCGESYEHNNITAASRHSNVVKSVQL